MYICWEKNTEQLRITVKKIGKRRKFCSIISEIGQVFQDNLANLFIVFLTM